MALATHMIDSSVSEVAHNIGTVLETKCGPLSSPYFPIMTCLNVQMWKILKCSNNGGNLQWAQKPKELTEVAR